MIPQTLNCPYCYEILNEAAEPGEVCCPTCLSRFEVRSKVGRDLGNAEPATETEDATLRYVTDNVDPELIVSYDCLEDFTRIDLHDLHIKNLPGKWSALHARLFAVAFLEGAKSGRSVGQIEKEREIFAAAELLGNLFVKPLLGK